MDFSAILTEFVVPGVLLNGSVMLLVTDVSVGRDAVTNNFAHFGSVAVAVFLLCVSYVIGVLCSELGTRLVRRKGNAIASAVLERYQYQLRDTPWEVNRDTHKTPGWSDFSYMRAACRPVDGVRGRIESHENVLRILRPSLVVLPLASACVLGYITRHVSWPTYVDIALLIVIPGATFFFTRAAFCQRLSTAVRSTVNHYASSQSSSR